MAIKLLLKRKLALNEMTQKELALRTGIRPPTISAICQNTAKHIPLDVLDKICDTLQCQPGEIMEYIQTMECDSPSSAAASPKSVSKPHETVSITTQKRTGTA